jgi:hypothetical protein
VGPGIGSTGDRAQPVWESGLIFEPSGTHATPLENHKKSFKKHNNLPKQMDNSKLKMHTFSKPS